MLVRNDSHTISIVQAKRRRVGDKATPSVAATGAAAEMRVDIPILMNSKDVSLGDELLVFCVKASAKIVPPRRMQLAKLMKGQK
jgi:hypothetical protein